MNADLDLAGLEALQARLKLRKPGWKSNISHAPNVGDLVNPDGPEAADAIATLLSRHKEMREALEAIDLFGTQRNLELSFYSPVYGDDDDQSEEWRVYRRGGSINDREWDQVGAGATPAEAMKCARTALAKDAPHVR